MITCVVLLYTVATIRRNCMKLYWMITCVLCSCMLWLAADIILLNLYDANALFCTFKMLKKKNQDAHYL